MAARRRHLRPRLSRAQVQRLRHRQDPRKEQNRESHDHDDVGADDVRYQDSQHGGQHTQRDPGFGSKRFHGLYLGEKTVAQDTPRGHGKI